MPPDGRVLLAFRPNETLDFSPTWTRIDSYDSLVTSYQIDRGRQIELDQTDTGRATVQIADPDGLLDPTNPGGPFFGQIEPLIQAMLGRHNPVDDTWYTRYRGWVEQMAYTVHPSQRVNMLTLSLVDIFEILAAVEMQPGVFGDVPPKDPEAAGMVFFDNAEVDDRINQVLVNSFNGDTGKVDDWSVVFSGNVAVSEASYSPGESPMTAIQEAADAEFPGSPSNVYTDRLGRLVFHGRYSKFKPDDVDATTDEWDFIEWKVGDGEAVHDDPVGTAHLREFGFERGLSHIINSATATPGGLDLTSTQLAAQLVQDTTSLGTFGYRSWSAENLLTDYSLVTGVAPDPLGETRRFAEFYIANYAQPRNRATNLVIRSMRPGGSGATKTWELMSKIDIADRVRLTVHDAGGGGFNDVPFFVEGVHETVSPLGVDYDNVTLTLDLSPDVSADYDTNMFPEINPPEDASPLPPRPVPPPGPTPIEPPPEPTDDGLNYILDQPFTWGGTSFKVPPRTWTTIPFTSPVMVRQSNVTSFGGPAYVEIAWDDPAAGGWLDPSTPRTITIPHDMPFIQGDPLSWIQVSLRVESPPVAESTSRRMIRVFETTHQKPVLHAGSTRDNCFNTPPEFGGVLDVWREDPDGGIKFAAGDTVDAHGNMMVVPNQSYEMYFDGLNWLPRETYRGTANMPMLKAGMRLVPQVWHDAPGTLTFHCDHISGAPIWKPHFVVLQWCQRAWGPPWSDWPVFT